jgi:hypothetical protein
MKIKNKILIPFFLSAILIFAGCNSQESKELRIILKPGSGGVITQTIQQAIDSCGNVGGGTVYFPAGKYISGGLHLRSNVTLEFEKGAILEGSNNLADYGEWQWTNALIMGENLKNVAIIGEGLLDGIDLKNPKGEAGFRGPHCIRLTNCDSITVKDITITRSANWAMNFRHCGYGFVENVKVRGGHDALHTRFCNNFDVRNCDFRTGDDCFAGNDNKDFYIENCLISTSCNAFRFGCLNLVAKNCSIWGPGEYIHIKQNRNNTLSAFTHFSPEGEEPKLVSGNWLIEDFTIHYVDQVFNYNFTNGLWQTGQPATEMTFKNLTVTDVKKALYLDGDSARSLKLVIENASITERKDSDFDNFVFEGRKLNVPAFFNANQFGSISLKNVSIETNSPDLALMAVDGNKIVLDSVCFLPAGQSVQLKVDNVKEIFK